MADNPMFDRMTDGEIARHFRERDREPEPDWGASKTCSACGAIVAKMPLNVREWECASCGTYHDRDVNAAKILLAAGLAVAACGDGVRPARA